jgi:pSer/pThr/pTyr-binding forkhead associated (FHA) protein
VEAFNRELAQPLDSPSSDNQSLETESSDPVEAPSSAWIAPPESPALPPEPDPEPDPKPLRQQEQEQSTSIAIDAPHTIQVDMAAILGDQHDTNLDKDPDEQALRSGLSGVAIVGEDSRTNAPPPIQLPERPQAPERPQTPDPDAQHATPHRKGLHRDRNQLEVSLVLFQPDAQPTVHKLRRDVTTLGRGLSCDVVLEDDAASRLHASINYKDGRLELIDEGSRNGLSINGHPISLAQLREGDHIEVGACTMRVVMHKVGPKDLEPGLAPQRPPMRLGQMRGDSDAPSPRLHRPNRISPSAPRNSAIISPAARQRANSLSNAPSLPPAPLQPNSAISPPPGVTWAGIMVGVLLCVLGLALALALLP